MVGSNRSGSEVLRLCPHAVTALESLLRFKCDRKLTGDAPTTLCSISKASNTRVPLLVDFSFPLPEKKTGKEKKKTKKVSSEGEPIADGSAEVHKKKKKVCARPWDGVPWGELFCTAVVMLILQHARLERNGAVSWPCWQYRGGCS